MGFYTIGYEGLRIEDFLAHVKEAQIDLIVDVRSLPLSRKRGFSKTALAASLAEAGIGYAHRVALGTPKTIRARYKKDHDFEALRVAFEEYLGQHTHSLLALTDLIEGKRACLLCYEADPALCHRSLITDAVQRLGGPVATHLH